MAEKGRLREKSNQNGDMGRVGTQEPHVKFFTHKYIKYPKRWMLLACAVGKLKKKQKRGKIPQAEFERTGQES